MMVPLIFVAVPSSFRASKYFPFEETLGDDFTRCCGTEGDSDGRLRSCRRCAAHGAAQLVVASSSKF